MQVGRVAAGIVALACLSGCLAPSSDRLVRGWNVRVIRRAGSLEDGTQTGFLAALRWSEDSFVVSEITSNRLMWLDIRSGDLSPVVEQPWRPNPVYSAWRNGNEIVAASMPYHLSVVKVATQVVEPIPSPSFDHTPMLGAIGPGCDSTLIAVPWTRGTAWHNVDHIPFSKQTMVVLGRDGKQRGTFGAEVPAYASDQAGMRASQWQAVGCVRDSTWFANLYDGVVGTMTDSAARPTTRWRITPEGSESGVKIVGSNALADNVITAAIIWPLHGLAVARYGVRPFDWRKILPWPTEPLKRPTFVDLYDLQGRLVCETQLEAGGVIMALVPAGKTLYAFGYSPTDQQVSVPVLYELSLP